VSPHFPVLVAKQVASVLKRHGFALVGQKGSLKSIIEGSGLDVDDFR